IQVDTGAQAAQAEAGAAVDTGAGKAADAKDALAGLNKDDRQRITDLQKKIVDDLQAGDADAALDAATELVSQLIDKANLHQMGNSHQQGIGQTANAQAQDLANMVAGAGVTLDIRVQTNQTAIDTTAQNAATVVDAMTLMDFAAMGQPGAGQGQTSQQNTQGGPLNQGPAPVALQAGPVVDTAPAAPVADDTRAFSSVLAAQVEASAPTTEQTTTQQPVTALAGIGATQASDKAAAAPQAAPAARAPRVPLQQQVMEQINVQIDKAVKDGVDTVKIQLKPLDLGKIEIKLEVIDGRVSATVTADKPETLALLQKDSKGLEKALEDAGLKPEANSTSFSLRGGEHQQTADRGNTNQRSGRNRGRGQGLAAETASVGSAQSAQSKRPGFRSGVDISV
ncbi:MAG: flagellar hook-length control protein FliK, partial [Magnetospirillum sp.]